MDDKYFKTDFFEGILYIRIKGDIDHHTVSEIRGKIDGIILLYRAKSVVMDLSDVDFMDSSGLGLILGRYAVAGEIGADFKVCNPCSSVEKILALAGTGKIIQIYKTNEKVKENEKRTDKQY